MSRRGGSNAGVRPDVALATVLGLVVIAIVLGILGVVNRTLDTESAAIDNDRATIVAAAAARTGDPLLDERARSAAHSLENSCLAAEDLNHANFGALGQLIGGMHWSGVTTIDPHAQGAATRTLAARTDAAAAPSTRYVQLTLGGSYRDVVGALARTTRYVLPVQIRSFAVGRAGKTTGQNVGQTSTLNLTDHDVGASIILAIVPPDAQACAVVPVSLAVQRLPAVKGSTQ